MKPARDGEIEMVKVQYHSTKWALLVELGYVTMYVEDGVATMHHPKQPYSNNAAIFLTNG